MEAISANCWLNCAVNVPGMCCTTSTAPGKFPGNAGTNLINAAGPPVDAATTTTGKRSPPPGAGVVKAALGYDIDKDALGGAQDRLGQTTEADAARRHATELEKGLVHTAPIGAPAAAPASGQALQLDPPVPGAARGGAGGGLS